MKFILCEIRSQPLPGPQNASLRLRVSANTAASSAFPIPIALLNPSLFGLQNGFVASSFSTVVGTVGIPAARAASTSARRAMSAAFSGSTVAAKRARS